MPECSKQLLRQIDYLNFDYIYDHYDNFRSESLSGIAVLGDAIREYIPVNLILIFGFINVGIMLLRMYLRKKFEYV